jgi:hypothetical protein
MAGAPGNGSPSNGLSAGAPLGVYDGRPWFLPLVGAWYRLLDCIG